MFCTKCGTQNPEGAGFCVKCGAKLVADNPGPEKVAPPPSNAAGSAQPVNAPNAADNSGQQTPPQSADQTAPPVQQWSAQPQQPYAVQQAPVKKKSKVPFIAIGAIVLVIAAVLFVVFGSRDNVDYVASVKAFQPFADSLDISYSYGEVLDKYISDAKWESHKTDTGADVEISGTLSGTERVISITVNMEKIPDNPDMSMSSLKSVTIDGETIPDKDEASTIIAMLFAAYDEGYSDFAEIADTLASEDDQDGVNIIGDTIEVNQTDTHYDDTWGNVEVTVKYVDFVDKLSMGILGYDSPDEDFVYLRAFISLKNIDTKTASLLCSERIIYDNTYTYSLHTFEGSPYDIKPLSSDQECTLIFEVPKEAMESDKSLVLTLRDDSNEEQTLLFTIRDGGTPSKSKPSTSSSTTTPESAFEPASVGYATVQEYLNDPEVRQEVDAAIAEAATDEMQLSIEATDDTLFYIFEFDSAALFDADLNAVTRELEDGLQSQADTFVGIAQDISDVVDVDNAKVVVIYKISTGNELCRREYSAY